MKLGKHLFKVNSKFSPDKSIKTLVMIHKLINFRIMLFRKLKKDHQMVRENQLMLSQDLRILNKRLISRNTLSTGHKSHIYSKTVLYQKK